MKPRPHERVVGDLVKVIPFQLTYQNAVGTYVHPDLNAAGITGVTFRMINTATNVTKVSRSACVIDAGASGTGYYQPVAADVDTAGIYHGFFEVTDSGSTDNYPVKKLGLRIEISSDTQSAKEAYDAAIAAL